MNIYRWYSSLSRRQRFWLFSTILIMILISAMGILVDRSNKPVQGKTYTIDMTFKEIAPDLKVTGKALAAELGLSPQLKGVGKMTAKELGVTQEELDKVVEHLLSHTGTVLKYYVYVALFFGGLMFMIKLGRPEKSGDKPGTGWYPMAPYLLILLISVAVAGFYLGKSPNPMEGIVKVFKSLAGLYPDPWVKLAAFIFFIAMAIIGNKLICGWACPYGALQELIYTIPVLRKLKKGLKLPFLVTNIIRAGLFLLTILILFGVMGDKKGFVLYHDLNPFNLFDLKFGTIWIALTIIITLAAAFIIYRPFCRVICPFGLFSWLAERISIFRVRIDRKKCTECGQCITACPLGAAGDMVMKKKMPEDCFSCARCLNKCPVDAIRYK